MERLRVLVALKEEGTLTKAAQRLNMSQPTASHHLARLAEETDAVLVHRRGRGLILTAEGIILAERGSVVISELDKLGREVTSMTRLERGTVRMASFPSATATIVPGIITRLRCQHPGLSLELVDCEPPEAAQALATGSVDVALTFTFPGDDPAFNETSEALSTEAGGWAEKLFTEQMMLVTACGTVEAEKATPKVLRALGNEIWHTGCPQCRSHLMAVCQKVGISPATGYCSDDTVAIQALIAAGVGVTLLPGLALEAHHNPGVDAIPVEEGTRSIYLATRGADPHTPAVRAVIAAARAEATRRAEGAVG